MTMSKVHPEMKVRGRHGSSRRNTSGTSPTIWAADLADLGAAAVDGGHQDV